MPAHFSGRRQAACDRCIGWRALLLLFLLSLLPLATFICLLRLLLRLFWLLLRMLLLLFRLLVCLRALLLGAVRSRLRIWRQLCALLLGWRLFCFGRLLSRRLVRLLLQLMTWTLWLVLLLLLFGHIWLLAAAIPALLRCTAGVVRRAASLHLLNDCV